MPRSRNHNLILLRTAGRVRWRTDDARWVLDRFVASGLTIGAFAAREGLSAQRLYRWRARLGGPPPAAAGFIEVTPMRTVSAAPIEVTLSSGDVLRVPETFSDDALRRLLAVLGERTPRC